MLKLLIIGTNNSYTSELEVMSSKFGMEILGTYSSYDEIQEIITSSRPDIIIASDNLFIGTTLPQIIDILWNQGYRDNVFFVLKHETYVNYLYQNNMQYVFEDDVPPQKLLQMIQEVISPSQQYNGYYGGQGNNSYKPTYSAPYNTSQNQQNMMRNDASYRGGFRSMMIAINSPKGGVGKTSLSIELSTMLAQRGKEVDWNPNSRLRSARHVETCLVDFNASFDTMASSLSFVRELPNYETVVDWGKLIEQKIYDNLSPNERKMLMADPQHDFGPFIDESRIIFSAEEVKQNLIRDPKTGLYVLPSVSLPFDVEYVKPAYLRIILQQIRNVFDIVIIDTGNNISYFTVEALRAADEVFFVTAPTIGSATVLRKLTKNLQRLHLSQDKINLIVNYPNGSNSELSPEQIAEKLQLPLVSVLPFDEGVRNSHEHGQPYAVNNKKSKYAHEIVKLAQQICPLWTAVPKKNQSNPRGKKKKRGFLGFLFN